jgi:micrococcal nuclease
MGKTRLFKQARAFKLASLLSLIIFGILLLTNLSLRPNISSYDNSTFLVLRVIDGDTFEIEGGIKVRLIGINAPENPLGKNPECFARESYEALFSMIMGKAVILTKDVSDKDRYGRLLRYAYIDDTFVNEELVKKGFAEAVPYPPDILFWKKLERAQDLAQEQKIGIWKCGL